MSLEPKIYVKFLDPEAEKYGLPLYRYHGDAGADLHVILNPADREHGMTIFPGERKALPTGIAIRLPPGFWARIVHRSSTERRMRLRVVEGTIDNGFLGNIFVQVANENSFPIVIGHGDRLAQLIISPVIQLPFEKADDLGESDRGERGFGSTGHNIGVLPLGVIR